MTISKVEVSSDRIGHSGLALIGEMARISGLDDLCNRFSPKQNPQIGEWEIIRTLCGLMSQGKTDFDNVRQVKDDEFFKYALGIKRIPSSEIMRQRFLALSLEGGIAEYFPECSLKLWKNSRMRPETINVGSQKMVRMDIDMSLMDNADTKKEGARHAYNKTFGFSPVFAHLGAGWMVNMQLRPGNVHSQGPGTRAFLETSIDYGQKMIPKHPLLTVMDSGFDSGKLLKPFHRRKNVHCIIKHNLRKEYLEKWLEEARENAQQKKKYKGKKEKGIRYWGSVYRKVDGIKDSVRMVYQVTEINYKKGQALVLPEIRVQSFWTTLDIEETKVIKLYRERGTSEQYHSEFKRDLNMERLPCTNFEVNRAFLFLGMQVYNMLRVISQYMVLDKDLGLKTASRRRIKTIINNIMFMCGKITREARMLKLKLACPPSWQKFFAHLMFRFKQA